MKHLSKSLVMLLAAVVLLAGCTKKSSEKQILSFSFYSPEVEATIMESAKTIVATVPTGTDLTALVPIITVSEKATINPASGVRQDFTNTVMYTVTAEDGSQASYAVAVTVEGNGGGNGGGGGGEEQQYSISATANPTEGGTVSGYGLYASGESCTLIAMANSGYTFTNWTENGSEVSTDMNYTFTVTGSRNLVANFTYNGGGGGSSDGLFSVSETKKVYFAPGNLQATTTDLGTTWTWAFAQNQWDYVGDAAANNAINGNGTVSTNGTVDMFGWSTSATYFGIHNSEDDADYSGDFVDWGTNAITNGGGYNWFTLSEAEWRYMFDNHTKGWTTVNGVKGWMVRPDGVTTAIASSYTATEWGTEEAVGALFLPAAGRRWGTSNNVVGDYGLYWSSTPYGSYGAYHLCCSYDFTWDVEHYYDTRPIGYSVRLARQ